MKIKLALTSDPKDDSYRIIVEMSEKEVRGLATCIEETEDAEGTCNCELCQFGSGLKGIIAKINQP